jgi:hypothetical protein
MLRAGRSLLRAVYLSSTPWVIDTAYFTTGHPDPHLSYFNHLLKSMHLVGLDKSTAVPGLSRDDYSRLAVPVPPQRERSSTFGRNRGVVHRPRCSVDDAERAQANLKRYQASVLKAACEKDWFRPRPNSRTDHSLLGLATPQRVLGGICPSCRLYGQADRSVDRFPPYHTLVREPTSFGIPDS